MSPDTIGTAVKLSPRLSDLAIYYSSELLGLKEGTIGYSIAGAGFGMLIASSALLLSGILPKTYLAEYCAVSLPIIVFAQLAYDLTIK